VVSGVVEEKNNRVVEIILSTVRPRHLLAGKVIGIGLLGLAQLALVAGLAATLLIAGVFDAPAGLGGSVALVIPLVRARFRALRSRLRRRGRPGLPAAERRHGGTTRHVHTPRRLLRRLRRPRKQHGRPAGERLTVFPLTAPLVLPARSALVGVPLWEHVVAVLLVLVTIYALVRLAGRIYGQGLLRSGPRLGVRAAWHLTAAMTGEARAGVDLLWLPLGAGGHFVRLKRARVRGCLGSAREANDQGSLPLGARGQGARR
jgi:ABC-2 type transport system permease protein